MIVYPSFWSKDELEVQEVGRKKEYAVLSYYMRSRVRFTTVIKIDRPIGQNIPISYQSHVPIELGKLVAAMREIGTVSFDDHKREYHEMLQLSDEE